jgi:formylglycine-generating enzyme required for sulfatase activity
MKRIPRTLFALFLGILAAGCGTPSTPIVPTRTLPPVADTPTATSAPTDTPVPSPTPVPTLGIGSTQISPADGMTLVYVPAGPFLMGSLATDTSAYPDEVPQHTVTLDAYWIDRTEVTTAQYALCVAAGACKPPRKFTSNSHDHYYNTPTYADFPVIFVDWQDAQNYCQWAGRRLPTEAEWEKAVRGPDGQIYPWGNQAPDGTQVNFNDQLQDVSAVDKYPAGASLYGVLDLAGNVWEWTADWYGSKYYAASPESNPTGPDSGTQKVLRGGSWLYSAEGLRGSYRYAKAPTFFNYEIGFRCAVSPQP